MCVCVNFDASEMREPRETLIKRIHRIISMEILKNARERDKTNRCYIRRYVSGTSAKYKGGVWTSSLGKEFY